MQKRLMPLMAAFVLALGAPSFAENADNGPDLNQIVASVNGTNITLGHMAAAKASLPDQYRDLPANILFPGILDQLVQQTLLMQSFEGMRPERIVLALENEERSLVAAEVVEGIMEEAVSDVLVNALYAERFANTGLGEEYNAAHILLETEEEALRVKTQIDDGADFAATAREKSTGPSGPRGGDLGWFGTGVMVASFEQAVTSMRPGEVSEPIKTQFGWHIIKLLERRQKEAPEIENVRAELEQEIRTTAVTDRITELTALAQIDRSAANEIDPTVLEQIDLSKLQGPAN